jgi:hypothetical protein
MGSTALATQPPAQVVPIPGKYAAVHILRIGLPPRLENAMVIDAAGQSAPRPTKILLGTLNDFGFRVAKAIPVQLDFREACVIASWQDIDEFGSGNSISSACQDLGHTLSELYRSLETDQARLGPDLQHVWAVLQEYLVRRK